MESQFKLPTETVDLPSKGLLYPEDSPLSSGKIEMKYMTAKEEDILTNQNYIKNGTVIDKLLNSLIVTEGVSYDNLLIGDKNAIMMAARVLSYGKDYSFKYMDEEVTVDLSALENKDIDYTLLKDRKNDFIFDLPSTGNSVTIKILTHKDETLIEREIEGNKKINKNSSTLTTTRLKHMITSVNGNRETKEIRNFVDNFLLAKDARAIRKYYSEISPDIRMEFYVEDRKEEVEIPIGIGFFWPDAAV
jgi:hypothetical protein